MSLANPTRLRAGREGPYRQNNVVGRNEAKAWALSPAREMLPGMFLSSRLGRFVHHERLELFPWQHGMEGSRI